MNLHLNTDGPISISQKSFAKYQTMPLPPNIPDFDYLFYTWINEGIDPDIRRLCLRDLLRQDQNIHSDKSYFNTGRTISRLLSIDVSKSEEPMLSQHLRYRPKLLQEFLEEFLYFLEHSDPPKPHEAAERHTILEALFPIVDEATGNKLLPYYNVYDPDHPNESSTEQLLINWSNPHNPTWFRTVARHSFNDELQREISQLCENNANLADSQQNLDDISEDYPGPAIYSALSFMYDYARGALPEQKTATNLDIITILLDTIYHSLPYKVCILPYHILIPILYQLPPAEALAHLRSHLLSCFDNHIEDVSLHDARNFLFWAEGLARQQSRHEDPQLLQAISSFRATIHECCKD